jgi:hypothetical protein
VREGNECVHVGGVREGRSEKSGGRAAGGRGGGGGSFNKHYVCKANGRVSAIFISEVTIVLGSGCKWISML